LIGVRGSAIRIESESTPAPCDPSQFQAKANCNCFHWPADLSRPSILGTIKTEISSGSFQSSSLRRLSAICTLSSASFAQLSLSVFALSSIVLLTSIFFRFICLSFATSNVNSKQFSQDGPLVDVHSSLPLLRFILCRQCSNGPFVDRLVYNLSCCFSHILYFLFRVI
jgi:hypothetical protein